MKRFLGGVVALCAIGMLSSAAEAGKRKKVKGPAIPAAGWDALVKAGHRSALYRTDYDGATQTATLVTGEVKKVGDVTKACIQIGEDCVYEVAVGPKGVWFGIGGLGDDALKGAPTFAFGEPGWKQGDDYVRYDGDEVCVGWANSQYECDDVCYWEVCMAPDAGITSVDGTASPDMAAYAADSAACLAPETYVDGLAAADGSVTACAENECRSVDVKTGAWTKVAKPAGVQATSTSASSAANATNTIRAEITSTELVTKDVAGQVLARKTLAADTGIGDMLFVEGFLVVESYDCAGPCQQWDVYDPMTLKKKATVGGKDPVIAGARPIHLSGAIYAFVDAFGAQVVLFDMKKGKQKKKVKTKKFAIDPGVGAVSAIGVDGGVAMVYSPLSQVVMVSGKGKVGKAWYGPGTCHASQ